MCEIEVEAVMPKIINRTAARTSFQDSQTHLTFLFSEWSIERTDYSLFILVKCILFHRISNPRDSMKHISGKISLNKGINCSKITIAWKDKENAFPCTRPFTGAKSYPDLSTLLVDQDLRPIRALNFCVMRSLHRMLQVENQDI